LNEPGEATGGVDYAAVCAAIKRFEKLISQDKKLAQAMGKAE